MAETNRMYTAEGVAEILNSKQEEDSLVNYLTVTVSVSQVVMN